MGVLLKWLVFFKVLGFILASPALWQSNRPLTDVETTEGQEMGFPLPVANRAV